MIITIKHDNGCEDLYETVSRFWSFSRLKKFVFNTRPRSVSKFEVKLCVPLSNLVTLDLFFFHRASIRSFFFQPFSFKASSIFTAKSIRFQFVVIHPVKWSLKVVRLNCYPLCIVSSYFFAN